MTLDELERLAKEANDNGRRMELHLGYDGNRAGSYVAQVRNDTLIALVKLCRMQHKAIKQREPRGYAYLCADKAALAAYEEFNREQT